MLLYSSMKVGEVCNREVVIIRKDDSILEAAQRMRDYHVGCLLVVDDRTPTQSPIGIVTDRDIVVEVVAQAPESLGMLLVGDVMSIDLLKVFENDDLDDVTRSMRARGIRRVPVINERGGLEGILALDDLVEIMAEQMEHVVELMRREVRMEKELRP